MSTPSSESEETCHLNAKQANEITLSQIKNAAFRQRQRQRQRGGNGESTADDFELANLLQDFDGQEVMCKKQQLLPQSTTKDDAEKHKIESEALRENLDATHQDKPTNVVTRPTNVINVGSTDNDESAKVRLQEPKLQLKCDNMTQYGGSTATQTHSKLDIQKFPQDIQQQQKQKHEQEQQKGTERQNIENSATIIPAQPTSLNATTISTTTTTTSSRNAQTAMTTTAIAATIAQGVGVTVNIGNINNENNGSALPGAHVTTRYKGPKFWRYIVRYWSTTSQKIALFVIFLLLWALAYCIVPNYALPGNGIMRLVFLFVGAELAGILVTHVHLPDMLGMLFFGVLYTNVGLANFSGYEKLEAILRELALINIMLLAGLGLNASAFKKLWFMILRLTVVPTLAEVAIIMVLARYLLSMSWSWGILLGLVITAVSPNVVVTIMLKLKEDRLGLNNGIHTIIYATTTCNDVLAIFAFGVLLGVIFSTGSLAEQILQGPVGIGIGIAFGYIYGMFLQYLPSTKSTYMNGLRFVLTILGGCVAVFGSKAIGYPSAGALGCASLAFIASIGWKRQERQRTLQQQQQQRPQQQQNANENSSVPRRLDLLWKFLKPVSFALIGKEINFSTLDGKVVGYGLVLIAIGSLLRSVFAYASTYGGGLSWRERAYITISGFPKATVQAALGPIALDLARSLNIVDAKEVASAGNVLIVSVLAIIFTAPLGAILMLRFAPHLLQKSDFDEVISGSADTAADINMDDNKATTGEYGCVGNLRNSKSKFPSESNLSCRSNRSQCTVDVANYVNAVDVIDLSEGELSNRIKRRGSK